MIDPVAHTARATAHRLAAELGPGLATDVEAALHARGSTRQPEQYLDPAQRDRVIDIVVDETFQTAQRDDH